MSEVNHKLLMSVLESEKSILSRTDQKAYTMLSILGVFMVFFIVYFRLLAVNVFIMGMLSIYFTAAFLAIYNLIKTMMPRVHREFLEHEAEEQQIDPTFFGGIHEFKSSQEYYDYMLSVMQDADLSNRMIARQIHSVALINWTKNLHLRRGMYFFIAAIGTELIMILSTFLKKAYLELFI